MKLYFEPVDYDPFADEEVHQPDENQHLVYEPVDYDPFAEDSVMLEENPQPTGMFGAFKGGVKNTMRHLGTAFDVATGDDEGVRASADAAMVDPNVTLAQEDFRTTLAQYGDPDGVWEAIKNVAKAAWNEPKGAFHEVISQSPNSGVILGSMGTGAAIGTMIGGPVGTLVGGIGGLFFGNTAIETGAIGSEMAMEGEYDRGEALKSGDIKGGVITGVDTVTLGLTKWLTGTAGRAATKAVERTLAKHGVDLADDAAVRTAFQNKAILKEARAAGEHAAAQASKGLKPAAGYTGSMAGEIAGEGVGEYLGSTLAPGVDADLTDAVLESFMSMPQSIGEVGIGKSLNLLDKKPELADTNAGFEGENLDRQPDPAQPLDDFQMAMQTAPDDGYSDTIPFAEVPNAEEQGWIDEIERQRAGRDIGLEDTESVADPIQSRREENQSQINRIYAPPTHAMNEGIDLLEKDIDEFRRTRSQKASVDALDRRQQAMGQEDQQWDTHRFNQALEDQPDEAAMPLPADMPHFQRNMEGTGYTPFAGLDDLMHAEGHILPEQEAHVDDGIDVSTPEYKSISELDQEAFQQGLADNFGAQDMPAEGIMNTKPVFEHEVEPDKVNTEPSEAQIKAGNYKKDHIKIDGLNITIENPDGSTRKGKDKSGKEWESVMHGHYGYFKRTLGKDGDQVDVVVKPGTETSPKVFVVDQIDPDTGRFDEHKVMFGYSSAAEAEIAYLSNYEPGWQGFGEITEMDQATFKEWLKDGKRTKKPLAVSPENSKPINMTFEEFEKEYRQAFKEMMKYPPDQVGSGHWAEKMADLEAKHPEWAEKVEKRPETNDKDSKPFKVDMSEVHENILIKNGIKPSTNKKQFEPGDKVKWSDKKGRSLYGTLERKVKGVWRITKENGKTALMPEKKIEKWENDTDRLFKTIGYNKDGQKIEIRLDQPKKRWLYNKDKTSGRGSNITSIQEMYEKGHYDYLTKEEFEKFEKGKKLAEKGEPHPTRNPDKKERDYSIPIGQNLDGLNVYEDENGVRSYESVIGHKSQQGVFPIPGGGINYDPPKVLFQNKRHDYLTEAEIREFSFAEIENNLREEWSGHGYRNADLKPDQVVPLVTQVANYKPEFVVPYLEELLEKDYLTDSARKNVEKTLSFMRQVDFFFNEFRYSKSYKTITQARKAVSEKLGKKIEAGSLDAKYTDEAIEVAAVRVANELVKRGKRAGKKDEHIFDDLVKLQGRMPNLSVRTSTSVKNQAYSTPLPLAFVVSERAGIDSTKKVYEPSAGNGALLIGAEKELVTANELNPSRAVNLIAETVVTSDGTKYLPKTKQDVVVANPPFGRVKDKDGHSKKWDISGQYETAQIDHAMVFKSLEGMKQKGRAVFIIGSVKNKNGDNEARKKQYRSPDKVRFYKTLFERYNVVDIFTMSGDLYKKQGAGWPVDILVIDGEGKSSLPLPGAIPPRFIKSLDQLKEQLNETNRVDTSGAGKTGTKSSDGEAADGGFSGQAAPHETPDRPDTGVNQSGEESGSGSSKPGKPADGSGGAVRDDVPVNQDSGKGFVDGKQPVSGSSESDGDNVSNRPDKQDQPDSGNNKKRGKRDGSGSVSEQSDHSVDEFSPDSLLAEWDKQADEITAKEKAQEAKQHFSNAVDKFKQINKLLGERGNFSTKKVDENVYAEIRDLLQAALDDIVKAGKSAKEFVKLAIENLSPKARPYFERFVQEDMQISKGGTQKKKQKPKPTVTGTESQAAYEPASQSSPIGTLTPVNMATASKKALATIKERYGSVDKYVAKELDYTLEEINGKPGEFGYFSGEQVDAIALAIHNIGNGAGFIIGDQTGVGKGRVVAAMQRYAIKKGLTPIFVTEKPNLYTDMYRDFVDIGMADIADSILITNAGQNISLTEDGSKSIKTKSNHNALLNKISAEGVLPSKYKTIFTTYDQLNITGSPRRRFISEMVKRRGMLIMDESHNAGGTEGNKATKDKVPRSVYFRELVRDAQSVFYSSATYAKRPGVMDLYAKTDMRLAVDNIERIGGAISQGGVPLQQAVASMLVEAGQYVRRERSFEGVDYHTNSVEIDKVSAEKIANTLAEVKSFSDNFAEPAFDNLADQGAFDGTGIAGDSAASEGKISSVGFSAIMHNLINQMLLSMKTQGAIDKAIAAYKSGQKPVITVANTMGSFIERYAEDNGLKPNDGIGLRFNDLIDSYLEKTREYTIRKPFGEKEDVVRGYIPDAALGKVGVQEFKRIKTKIHDLEIGNIPISPVDYILHKLTEAGMRAGEITGRTDRIEYRSVGQNRYTKRPGSEKSVKGRTKTIYDFNTDKLDALILNKSGSTGLSLHAIPKYGGHKPAQRHMIILQAEGNIDTHMQMLGRVHRAGQIIAPEYTQLMGDIPSEKRPAAVLASKMASLNANTTAAKDSELSAKETVDFMNKYGDKVAAGLMADFPELHDKLGAPLATDSRTQSGFFEPGAARKITGRIPLLPLADQEQLYTMLESSYLETIDQLNATGENDLEAKTFDLDAKVLNRATVFDQTGLSADSPFTAAAVAERIDMKKIGRSYTSKEVKGLLSEYATGSKKTDKPLHEILESAEGKHEDQKSETLNKFVTYEIETVDKIEDETRADAMQARLSGIREDWEYLYMITQPGFIVDVKVGDQYIKMTSLKVHQTGKPKNPLALGTWKVTFAVPDSMRRVVYPFSFLNRMNPEYSGPSRATKAGESSEATLKQFDNATRTARETRTAITGNLLAAYGRYQKGRIINFKTHQGDVRQGVLMPTDFDLEQAEKERPVYLNNPKDLEKITKQGIHVRGAKGDIKIIPGKKDSWSNRFEPANLEESDTFMISVPASKAGGSKYYLNTSILKAVGKDFVKAKSRMTVTVGKQRIGYVFRALINKMDEPFYTLTGHGKAKEILGIDEISFSTSDDLKPLSRKEILEGINDQEGGLSYIDRKGNPNWTGRPITTNMWRKLEDEGHIVYVHGDDIWVAASAYDKEKAEVKYSIGQTPGQGVTLSDIQKRFKDQQVFMSPDGSISIRMQNGQGLRIVSTNDMGKGDIQFAMESGRMGKNGVVLGKYKNRTITLNEDLASNFTRDHELYHFLKDIGVISKKDGLALIGAMKKMQKKGRLTFKVSNIKEENEANTFAQILSEREDERSTLIGSIIQKVMDFLDGIRYIGRKSARKIARSVESGEIFSEKAKNDFIQVTDHTGSNKRGVVNSGIQTKIHDAQVIRTEMQKTGDLLVPRRDVRNVSDAAEVLSGISDAAQEEVYLITTGKSGKVLEIHRFSKGLPDTASAHINKISGHLLKNKKAKVAYLVHNHVTRALTPSPADRQTMQDMKASMNLADIKLKGVIISDGHYVEFDDHHVDIPHKIKQKPTKKKLPVSERRVIERTAQKPEFLETADAAIKRFESEEDGILLADRDYRELTFIPFKKGITMREAAKDILSKASEYSPVYAIINMQTYTNTNRWKLYKSLQEGLETQGIITHDFISRNPFGDLYSFRESKQLYPITVEGIRALDSDETLYMTSDDVIREKFGTDPTVGERISSFVNKARSSKERNLSRDRFIKKTLDNLHFIKKRLGDESYKMHRMLTGIKSATFAMFLEHGPLSWAGNTLTVTKRNKGVLPFLKSIGPDWQNLLYWIAAKRAEELEAQDRENWLDREAREAIFAKVGTHSKSGVPWKAHNLKFQAINKNVLDIAEQAGLIDPEAREMWESNFYIPFYRILEDEVTRAEFLSGPNRSKKHISAQIRQLKGGQAKIGDPLENVLKNWMHLVDAAARNKSRAKAFETGQQIGLIEEVSKKELLKILGSEKVEQFAVIKEGRNRAYRLFDDEAMAEDFIDQLHGQGKGPYKVERRVTQKVVFANMKDYGILSFQQNGEPVYFKTHDEDLYESLAEVDLQHFNNFFMRMFGGAKRLLSYGATFGPAFRIRNMIRDTVHTAVVSKSFRPFLDTAKGFVKSMAEDQDYIEYMASGFGFGSSYVHADDPESGSRFIKRIVKREGRGSVARILTSPRKIFNAWEKIGTASENAARLGLYTNLKKKGASNFEAGFEGRDLMDFSMRGSAQTVQILTRIIPFLNARVQGMYKLTRCAKSDPKIFLLKASMLTGASLVLWSLFKDDDRYKDLEDWDKWTYYHFWIGEDHYRIPKPFEIGAFFSSLPESVANVLNETEEGKFVFEWFQHTARDVFNVDMPQLMKPYMEVQFNLNTFKDRPVVPEHMKRLRPSEQYQPWTSETMRMIGEKFNLSPMKLEHYVNGYFSTIGAMVLSGTDMVAREAMDYPSRPAGGRNPFQLGIKVDKKPRSTKYITRFYELYEEVDNAYRTMRHYAKTGQTDRAEAYYQKNRDLISLKKPAYKIRAKLSEINRELKRVQRSKINPLEKKERIEQLNSIKQQITRALFKKIRNQK